MRSLFSEHTHPCDACGIDLDCWGWYEKGDAGRAVCDDYVRMTSTGSYLCDACRVEADLHDTLDTLDDIFEDFDDGDERVVCIACGSTLREDGVCPEGCPQSATDPDDEDLPTLPPAMTTPSHR